MSKTPPGGHPAYGCHRLQLPRQRQHQRRGQYIKKLHCFITQN